MAKKAKESEKLRLSKIRHRAMRGGELPGSGRARVFKDRKKEASRKACRGRDW